MKNGNFFDAQHQWDSDEFRSTNGQIGYILVQDLNKANYFPKQSNNDIPNSDF